MLLETGKLSDVGYAIKENVPRSWRRGVEMAVAWKVLPWLQVGGNLTLSTNKIRSYTAYYDMYDNNMSDNMNDWNYMGQKQETFRNTDILMSPSLVGTANVSFRPFAALSSSLNSAYISWNGKYVGRQYFDNTSSADRSIPAYFVADLSLGYDLPLNRTIDNLHSSAKSTMSFSLHVNNLFNSMYYADAWLWRAYFKQDAGYYNDIGLYPQAPANFMFKVSLNF
jgi:iron complex outermembrane receptor protein